jgi:hypothetical protein
MPDENIPAPQPGDEAPPSTEVPVGGAVQLTPTLVCQDWCPATLGTGSCSCTPNLVMHVGEE